MDSGRRSTVRTSGPAQLVRQTSGWHSHPGLHPVTVVSGTLTVYGPHSSQELRSG
jgi:quercetin dioxygenase-like cupin family protein